MARMRLMQSAFDQGILAEVVTHEAGHAISLPRQGRVARFERVVRASRAPRLLNEAVIRGFVSRMFVNHVLTHMRAGDFNEYFAEAYAIWRTNRADLPEPVVRFSTDLECSAAVSVFHEPVSLADPDPSWARQYAAEAVLIERALAAFDPVIEHIGSTAVPLRAKPIIDIQVAVREHDVPATVDALRTLAYEHHG